MQWAKRVLRVIFCLVVWVCAEGTEAGKNAPTVAGKNAKTETKLLIKLPTRGKPDQFFAALDSYYNHLSKQVPYHFLITCDAADTTMNNPEIIKRLSWYPNLTLTFTNNLSTVDAYNRDIDLFQFDILLAASDESTAQADGFDKKILALMEAHFPDYDGVLNYNDGNDEAKMIAHPVVGKKFYDRLGYLYNPVYKSSYANDELTLIARVLGKEIINPEIIMKPIDSNSLVAATDEAKAQDAATFKARRDLNFDIETKFANDPKFSKVWSIMICTLEERKEVFDKIYKNLTDQINALNLNDKVEVIYICDNRTMTIGHKRNELMRMSKGKYVNFVDDDDDIHSLYVKIIYEQLVKDPDCVDLMGIITTNGKNPKLFIHTIAYDNIYTTIDGVYYRPPNHWNAMRKSIAAQFLFPSVNFGEDKNWTMQIARTGLLKKEAKIRDPYYYYNYDGKYG